MCGVSGRGPRPFAVGVLAFDDATADDAERRQTERVNLALDTYLLGYFLIDTVEVTADDVGYHRAEALASRTRADAFVVRGPATLARLERTAARLRMTIRTADDAPLDGPTLLESLRELRAL